MRHGHLASLLMSASLFAMPALASPPHAAPSHDNGHASAPAKDAHTSHWAYSGPTGPQHWGEKNPEHAACRVGAQQSPVDLSNPINAFTSTPQIDWQPVSGGEIVNNGHTLQMNLSNAGGLVRDGVQYKLIQFHFHTPSEHTLDGQHFPMEAHFVHAADDGRLAVIGVMFVEGANNATLDPVWWAAPGVPGKAAVSFHIDPENLLPKNRAAFRYQGSLTTPPCSEIVDWTVLKTPLTVSKAQLTVFRAMFGDNARPVQPLHRRFLLATPQ